MNPGSLRQAENRPSSKPDRVTRLRYTAGMIWSVSTLLRRSGVTMPVCVEKASMAVSPYRSEGALSVPRTAVAAATAGCLLYTSDAADDLLCVDLGGRRIIK